MKDKDESGSMWHWLVDVQRCCLSTPSCKWRFINGLHSVQVFPLQDWPIFNPLFAILCLWRFWLCKHHECLKWRQYILKWSLGTFWSYLHTRERLNKTSILHLRQYTYYETTEHPESRLHEASRKLAIQTMTLRWERLRQHCATLVILYFVCYWHPDSLT